MAQKKISRAVKLFGTAETVGKTRILTAGALTAELDNGALRHIRFHGTEVLRGISYLVRDKNWGTYGAVIEGLKIRQGKDRFSIRFAATCRDEAQAIRYDVAVTASSVGVLRFAAKGIPLTDFTTNRTGFVVLHPLQGVVGAPLEIVHTDGRKVKTRFPKFISPGQPAFEVRGMTHQVEAGVTATVLLEGNTFEMEDHRNWMDASYKTYVCSLLDPWPYVLQAGLAFEQSVTLTIAGRPKTKAARRQPSITVKLGDIKGRMPAIGVGVPMDEAEASLAAHDLVAKAGPSHLVCQVDGRKNGAAQAAAAFRALKEKTGKPVTLEIILPALAPAEDELSKIAADIAKGRLSPDAIVITQAHDLTSFQPGAPRPAGPGYKEMAAAVRLCFPGLPVGGGMLSYFTELNRKPVPKGLFEFVTHTVCPIVHASDDVSVMETLEALPSIIASARRMFGTSPYHLGPSGIAARGNPYGADVAANPDGRRVCLSDNDPRQHGLFAAAWNMGFVAAAARGGVDVMSLGALTGAQGVVRDTAVDPAFHVLAGFSGSAGVKRREALSSHLSKIECVAYDTAATKVLWLTNLTGQTQEVMLQGWRGAASLHMLDQRNFTVTARDPAFMKKTGTQLKRVAGLTLSAYAVARLTSI